MARAHAGYARHTMSDVPTFALIGCGNRGADAYGAWLGRHPDRGRVVAVADRDPARREGRVVVLDPDGRSIDA